MLVGEAPGQREDEQGKPFVGITGYELNNTYLKIAGLRREEVYVTNSVKCRPLNNRKPKLDETRECAAHFLPSELAMVDPEIVVLMGATACSLIPDIDLEAHHGIPRYVDIFTDFYGWEGWVFPTYHPAAGLHDSTSMIPLLEDFESLRKLVDGSDPRSLIPIDQYPKPVYAEINGEVLARLLEDNMAPNELSIDQENEQGEMRSVQVSRMPGMGFLFRTADEKAMSVFREHCARDKRFVYLLHNAPQDLDWLMRYGVTLPSDRLRDTMQEAFHLGNLPQGLKPLAYRLCGMQMNDYISTVDPPSRKAVAQWLRESTEFALPRIKDALTKRGKPKYEVTRNPLITGIKRILEHTEEEPEPGTKKYNPWDAWQKEKVKWSNKLDMVGEEEKSEFAIETIIEIENALGPMPVRGLAQVDKDTEIRYACRDSDATLRVAHVMSERRKDVGKEVAEKDYAQ
jgi:DNA polymerase